MLATFVLEVYKDEERKEMASAIQDLIEGDCWSTAGIYCYWDYTTRRPLYIGLASDLHHRFCQHNGLVRARKSTCKSVEISTYFDNNEKLGFSMVLQSSLSQPFTWKQKKKYKVEANNHDPEYLDGLGEDALQHIRILEGITIAASSQLHNNIPSWNKIGGNKQASLKTEARHHQLIDLLVNKTVNDNVSRASLKELDANGGYRQFECFLHSLRISPFGYNADMIARYRQMGGDLVIDELEQTNYLQKKLILS
ncbi:hypothetical protein [Chitinophaga sp.]|uniref:hypothetical protein n=1 Tax=Chitinophaga sp. TaxID=1869181 RepID=UPI0031CE6AE7